ncbi:Gfo/Idh/MocA family protein [Lactococcus sp.]|uniref:Gfo/Idh/MocA family protein n=1 Tax=Lactococcus sp. TaxID=44273 RepID=UPI0035B3CFC0
MIIGIIGATSNIASKAYLPVYAALQDEHRFILYSRDWNKAEEVRKKYKFEYATTDLAALETVDLVIIHAATSSHFELAKRYLAAGVHVLMDKPISENYEEVKTLYQLAEAHQVLFVIAFNRRFAPQTQKLKAIPHKNFIKITKNLAQHNGNLTFQLYDIFSHPLDTLVYLLDDEIKTHHAHIKLDAKGQLERAVVYLETETSMGIASMNLNSGAYRETFEVEAKGQTAIVSDLSELTSFTGIDQVKSGLNGWSSATYTRGFDAIVLGVLEAITQYTPEKRELLMENLKQKNVMTTHEIIAGMLDSL